MRTTTTLTRNGQNVPVNTEYDVPDGWEAVQVHEIFESFGGGTPDRGNSAYWGGGIAWLSSGDVKAEKIRASSESITLGGLSNSSASLCPPGSVLVVVRSGILKHTLPVAVLEREAAINQDIKCFDCGNHVLNNWLALAFRSSANEILALNREGTTVQSVKYDTLREFVLSVAPLLEQERIVAKIEELFKQVNASRDRLAKVSKILKRFRQSVLAAACSGRLTEDWRGRNHDTEDVAATLETIRKRQQAQAHSFAQTERLRQVCEYPEENDSSELPQGWRFVALNKLSASFDYGTSAKSQPSGRIPVLRMGNIQNGQIDWSDLVYTSDPEEIEQYYMRPDTVLFNRTNSPELVGKTAIYRGEKPAIFAGYLIRIVNEPELDAKYLNFCLNTSYAREFCSRVKTDGVSQSNINAQKLSRFEVPFCPLPEQHEIVRRAEALFKLADMIEKRVDAATRRTDKLTQAILAKAFRGELAPTEAELARREGRDYEPASALLERIRADRAKLASMKTVKSRVGQAKTRR